MADSGAPKKAPSIPVWQQPSSPSISAQEPSSNPDITRSIPPPDLDPLEQALRFLDDDSIRNSSRERKVAFLETKGLKPEQIEDLLDSQAQPNAPREESELKTVHDSNTTVQPGTREPQAQQVLSQSDSPAEAHTVSRSDAPPIITYPEFLLKPQKPPPLVTVDRLVTAAYVLAGLSALTYGASKYLMQPMLECLTDSRHDLALTAQASLSKLNTKLESSVSHVPYMPSLQASKQSPNQDSDTESIDSDPTELFHRDIATQTSPLPSRTSSLSSTPAAQSATDIQTSRLTALHSSLKSLLSSTITHFAGDNLQKSLVDMQSVIDKLDSSSQPLDAAYASPYSWQNTSTSKSKQSDQDSQAMKFRAEIRALKGAFLSSRNFPTARPAVPFTLPAR